MNPKKGKILEGQITRIEDEAAFVDVGLPRDVVIPRKELNRLGEIQSESLQEGEEIQVRVYHAPQNGGDLLVSVAQVDSEQAEGLHQTSDENPWKAVQENYQEGDLVEGVVTNVRKFGAFVRLPIGVEGMIHVSELEDGYTPSPWKVVQSGEEVITRIIRIEPDRERIELSLKRVSGDL